ncbi:MAG TPA: hypothetical protein VH559_13395 [Gemmatimonadaceae bacterium]|jgi:hypothetical protein
MVSKAPRLFVVGLIVSAGACARLRNIHLTPGDQPSLPTPADGAKSARTPELVDITSGPTLVQAMHDRYAGKWYKTLTMVQKTTVGLPSGGELKQTWYQASQFPGKTRIETDRAAKTGVLYVRDSVYSIAGGKLARADTGRNDLWTLGFDVYAQSPERTREALDRAGFDLTDFHETTWEGKPVYVVGALEGDTVSKQFWIERDRLLVVRMIGRSPQGRSDVRLNDYRRVGNAWVAREVEQYVNGKRRVHEQYSDVAINAKLSPALFDPKKWSSAPHWR